MKNDDYTNQEKAFSARPVNKFLIRTSYCLILQLLVFVFVSMMIFSAGTCGDAPAVPHKFTSVSDESCRKCHENGDNGATEVSHADRKECLKCHDGTPDASVSDNEKLSASDEI